MRFRSQPYGAARELCSAFNLQYGATVGVGVQIVAPESPLVDNFTDLFATGKDASELLLLAETGKEANILARLQFSEIDVSRTRARFFGKTIYPWTDAEMDDDSEYLPPEGRMLLLFSKARR